MLMSAAHHVSWGIEQDSVISFPLLLANMNLLSHRDLQQTASVETSLASLQDM